jgi:hypothetical protein
MRHGDAIAASRVANARFGLFAFVASAADRLFISSGPRFRTALHSRASGNGLLGNPLGAS